MVRIPDLYALQELDGELDALERTLADLRARLIEDESALPAQEHVDELKIALQAAIREQHTAADEAADGKARVTAVETKLYGGTVTVAKELRDLQKEFESLQRAQAERDEAAQNAASIVESIRAEIASSTQDLEHRRAQWAEEQAQITAEAGALGAKVTALRERREAAVRPIEAPTIALYDRLRRMRGGRAVARVERGTCLGCRISLPSHIFQRARSGMAVIQCPSCERILYVG